MGLFKRKNVWWFRFTYQGRQIRRSTEMTDKKLAEKVYHRLMYQVAEGKCLESPEGENKTLSDLLDKHFKEYSTPNKSLRSLQTETGMIKEMKRFFGDTLVKDVTPSLLAKYKSECREKKLSAASINYRRTLLNHAFKLAIREWEWLRNNPVEKISRERVRNERDRWLTLEEEKRLLKACVLFPTLKGNTTEPRYWVQEIVWFALNTGMRQDEILSLEWPNVDLFRKTATVVKSKNGEKRTIPLNQRLMELLKEKGKVRSIKNKYVFPNMEGNKIDASKLLRAFRNILRRAQLEDFRFHDLRHTFATRLAQAGVDFYKISKILGHKDIRMTQRYSHHYPESLRDGVEILDKISTNLAHLGSEETAISS